MNSNSFIRVQVRVQKKHFFEFKFKFEFGKMIEFFRVRVRSPATNSFRWQSVINVTKELFNMHIVKLYKGISADKNALVTFLTKLVSLLFKNVCKVWVIRFSDLLPHTF